MTRPVCLITGAGGRLGRLLSRQLSPHYSIVATYRSRIPDLPSQLQRPHDENRENPVADDLFCVQGDLTNRCDIRRVVEVALARFGRIDAIVNGAADVAFHGKLVELWQSEDYPQSQLLTNAIAPMQLVSAVYDLCWRDNPRDNAHWNRSVVNVSSYSGQYVYDDSRQAFYGASKAALNLLTMYLSLELAPYSVRANVVCPGQFQDEPATQRVVDTIAAVLSGTQTGVVVNVPEPGEG